MYDCTLYSLASSSKPFKTNQNSLYVYDRALHKLVAINLSETYLGKMFFFFFCKRKERVVTSNEYPRKTLQKKENGGVTQFFWVHLTEIVIIIHRAKIKWEIMDHHLQEFNQISLWLIQNWFL